MKRNVLLNMAVETGLFCKVEFIKKDGTLGRVHGRTGVKKYTRNGVRTTKESEYILFWDREKGYRNINRNTIVSVNGQKLKIKGNLC